MKHVLLFFLMALLTRPVLAADTTQSGNPRQSPWTIGYAGNWFVERDSDGLTLSITSRATILDCQGLDATLDDYLIGVKADVCCANATDSEGGTYVQKVRIICE